MKSMWKKIGKFNERTAVFGTKIFSNMYTFWIFVVWGSLPLVPGIPQAYRDLVVAISSALIQLAALPLLGVGAIVLNRAAERRAKEDHAMLHGEFAAQNEELVHLKHIHADVSNVHRDVTKILDHLGIGDKKGSEK